MNIKKELIKLQDEKYKEFMGGLVPGAPKMLGVRLPILRKFAKSVIKADYKAFLNSKPEFFEEKLLFGIVIGLIKDFKEATKELEKFVPSIGDWGVCDTLCSSLKITKQNKEEMYKFIKKYANSKAPFEVRFFLVMLLWYYVEEKYIDEIFDYLNKVELNDYYSKMGAAWLVSVCFVKFREKTINFLKNNKLDNETQNKSIRKIIESLRVSKEDKALIRDYRRN